MKMIFVIPKIVYCTWIFACNNSFFIEHEPKAEKSEK